MTVKSLREINSPVLKHGRTLEFEGDLVEERAKERRTSLSLSPEVTKRRGGSELVWA